MKITVKASFGIFLFLLCSCSPLISTFDQYAYVQATSLKVDALNLMSKATDSYATHEAEVNAVQLNIDKAIEYDKHRPHNEITNQLWNILNNPQGHLFGGFLVKWKKDGKCGDAYLVDKKKQIADSFDQIAELESKKIKTSQSSSQ